jgi:hypothetical protein
MAPLDKIESYQAGRGMKHMQPTMPERIYRTWKNIAMLVMVVLSVKSSQFEEIEWRTYPQYETEETIVPAYDIWTLAGARHIFWSGGNTIWNEDFSAAYYELIQPFYLNIQNYTPDFGPADMVEILNFYTNPSLENLEMVCSLYKNPNIPADAFNIFQDYYDEKNYFPPEYNGETGENLCNIIQNTHVTIASRA